jgi:hypothetical protein
VVDVEAGLVIGHVVEGGVQAGRRGVVGDGDVRVVGVGQVAGERSAAHGGGQQLAVADAGRHGHEDHVGDRPEGAGAAQVDGEAPVGTGDGGQVLLDPGQGGGRHVGRAEQGHMRRDQVGQRVAGPRPGGVELRTPRLRDTERDPDAYQIVGHRWATSPRWRAGGTRSCRRRRRG